MRRNNKQSELTKGTGDEAREGSDPSKAVIAGGSETDMRFGPYMNDVSRCYFCRVVNVENASKKPRKTLHSKCTRALYVDVHSQTCEYMIIIEKQSVVNCEL